ncbi:MAG: class I SAM-dependent methyltransferase [Patescibacteria group bacterium]|nr:class I SAM-dependent methyltransferase [Patescibacteria group bacterium]
MTQHTFEFGKNWQKYVEGHFGEEALERSMESLRTFLPVELTGKTFVDVGCGSGIHSLAALKLGARRVVSFDADPHSVEATRRLKAATAPEAPWEVLQGSMLDTEFLATLGRFDVVYCWGVAHHTGNLWTALDNLQRLLEADGVLFVAVYNEVVGRLGSAWWLRVKRRYNSLSLAGKKIFEWGYISFNFLKLILHGVNPFKVMRDYKRKRGMSWKIDLVDWLGGYPYEYARPEEIFSFYKEQHGMELVRLKTTQYIGCNQFIFTRK